jgi:hypothetical protein
MDLTGPKYGFSPQQQIKLERKEDLKKRGLSSPDYGDSLAYTFAVQILAPPRPEGVREYYRPAIRSSHGWHEREQRGGESGGVLTHHRERTPRNGGYIRRKN